jgi:hypothetical protein
MDEKVTSRLLTFIVALFVAVAGTYLIPPKQD